MTKQQEKIFIEECRSWKGTKWMHGVAVKGYKVDCIHFLVEIAKAIGWLDKKYEIKPYPRDWALHCAESKLTTEMSKFCEPIDLKDIMVGDILLYRFSKCNSHAAFYLGDNTAIHSHIQYGVVEFNIDEQKMKKHLIMAMRWKGNN